MNSSSFKHEGWLYWLAFLIAIGFRLIQLGASPLTDSEATLALQALQIAQGQAPLLSPQPGYILFTSILFGVIEGTNFMARFVPALVGSALVFTPYFFRDRIKPRPALILAFLFAIDPGLVALSRQASGTILAVTFLLFAWAMLRNRRLIPAGKACSSSGSLGYFSREWQNLHPQKQQTILESLILQLLLINYQ
jgi:predicted membrane-bound mannosyltransferase